MTSTTQPFDPYIDYARNIIQIVDKQREEKPLDPKAKARAEAREKVKDKIEAAKRVGKIDPKAEAEKARVEKTRTERGKK